MDKSTEAQIRNHRAKDDSENIFEVFGRTDANFVSLSPLTFLPRSAELFPDRDAVIYGSRRYSYAAFYSRCRQLASALQQRGIGKGDTVAIIACNTPEMVEAHFGIAMAGAVLNTINTRLDADTIAYILEHGEARLLITDSGFSETVSAALDKLEGSGPEVIDIIDTEAGSPGERLGEMDYEALLAKGDPAFDWQLPEDEWQALSLNYTSGTSGRPKGVVYHHRGSYLMTMGTIADWQLPRHPVYFYAVPLFHCNGWGHGWTMVAQAGTIICSRAVTAAAIYDAIASHGVTHFGGAPIVLGMILNADEADRKPLPHTVEVMTAGAPPPAAILEGVEQLGFNVTQVYGLTETYGHVVMCVWNTDWDGLDFSERASIKARQGVTMMMNESMRVVDTASRQSVPADGETMGEVVLRGNTVMKGYLKNPEATETAFAGGWFRSGDLAVVYPGGYMEIKDRLKDIIISGGENISSVEVEAVLHRHPAVAIAAVVAMPDEKWGEVPCAFLELKPGQSVTSDEITGFCREHMAGFKRPKRIVFCEIPKTATGKLQKFELRRQLLDGGFD